MRVVTPSAATYISTQLCPRRAAKGGRLVADVAPRPFPSTSYRGFVGQPVNCPGRCGWELFAREGCPHVAAAAVVAPEVAARIRHQPDAVAGVAAFLGGF